MSRGDEPGRLVGVDWLAEHLGDPELASSTCAPNGACTTGATSRAPSQRLHREIALRGTAPETGDAEREWLLPTPRSGPCGAAPVGGRRGRSDRVLRRHRARSPGHPRLLAAPPVSISARAYAHPRRRDQGLAPRGPPDDHRYPGAGPHGRRRGSTATARRARRFDHRDLRAGPRAGASNRATADDAPTRILDVRTAAEWVGAGPARAARRPHPRRPAPPVFRPAHRRGHVPSGRGDALDHPRERRRSGRDPRPRTARAACAPRSSGSSFTSSAGFEEVRSYAGSWEEWGNRPDSPIEHARGRLARSFAAPTGPPSGPGAGPTPAPSFRRSSVVERAAVNRLVVGSSPTAGATPFAASFEPRPCRNAVASARTAHRVVIRNPPTCAGS